MESLHQEIRSEYKLFYFTMLVLAILIIFASLFLIAKIYGWVE